MMETKAVANERIKLLANLTNTAAAAFLSAGVIGPGLAFFYGVMPAGTHLVAILAGGIVCISFSAGIHLVGRAVLGRIQE
jgi:hypothetical protein